MSLFQNEGSAGPHKADSSRLQIPIVMQLDSSDFDRTKAELSMASKTEDISSQSTRTGPSSSEIFKDKPRINRLFPKSQISAKVVVAPPISSSSRIPLPLKICGPTKIPPSVKNARPLSGSVASRKNNQVNTHTLEIQFINKNKRYIQMKKELMEKQKSVLDLYQNLVQIKKHLDELGKNVQLDEVKLLPLTACKAPSPYSVTGVGEQISMEVINGMKSSIEEIPKTLMNICKNLLSRRALIVELLESVTKSEINVTQVSDKIKSLKCEGEQLQQSLELVIEQHESKISELLVNWQKLLSEKQYEDNDSRIEEMRIRIKEEERLKEESATIIQDLQRKAEDQKLSHEKSIAELNGVLQALRKQATELEQELENEKKISDDIKSRDISNTQNLRLMATKINDLENDKKEMQSSNAEMHRTIRLMQDQMKKKENNWKKEKEEMKTNLKHQENLLQKLTADKNHFETRMEIAESAKKASEEEMEITVSSLRNQLQGTVENLNHVMEQRDEAVNKCEELGKCQERMKTKFKEQLRELSDSMKCEITKNSSMNKAVDYMQSVVKDLRIRELEDKVKQLTTERLELKGKEPSSNLKTQLNAQSQRLQSYELLLKQNQKKLNKKTTQLENVQSKITQVKVLEEQSQRRPSSDVRDMLDEGKDTLMMELVKKSIESENRLVQYKVVIDEQKRQMDQMGNLLRYRGTNAIKSSHNDLSLEKESLTRYSREVRAALVEVARDSLSKDKLIESMHEKITLREAQICKLENELQEFELRFEMTNGKRFKLQETVESLEKELQRAQVKLIQATKKKRGLAWGLLESTYEDVEHKKPNKKVSSYSNRLMVNSIGTL